MIGLLQSSEIIAMTIIRSFPALYFNETPFSIEDYAQDGGEGVFT